MPLCFHLDQDLWTAAAEYLGDAGGTGSVRTIQLGLEPHPHPTHRVLAARAVAQPPQADLIDHPEKADELPRGLEEVRESLVLEHRP